MLQALAVMRQSFTRNMRKTWPNSSAKATSSSGPRMSVSAAHRIHPSEHNRILSRLADTVGEKIGFKASAGTAKTEQ